jgi:hypothetical protein
MNQNILSLLTVLCIFGSSFALTNSARAQGSLTPPGAPAPSMVSLSQIYARLDARISITNSSTAVTLSQPGSYYLTTNLTVLSGTAITITTNDVALDLNGFTISSSAASAAGTAVGLNTGLINITVRDGFIQSGVTNKAATYAGPGFNYGIYGTGLTNITISSVSINGVLDAGIFLGAENSTVVENCTVTTAGSYGIEASTVKNSIAIGCGNTAIYADLVSDCRGISSGSGYGIEASTALNCYGQSSGSVGLGATTAQNCYGYCTGASSGLNATTAQNCYGYSSTGDGINAYLALNCDGTSSSGTADGVVASYLAQNCYGSSSDGDGLYAGYIAIGCLGSSTGSIGLAAYIGNSSVGTTDTGTAEAVTYKYNMQ